MKVHDDNPGDNQDTKSLMQMSLPVLNYFSSPCLFIVDTRLELSPFTYVYQEGQKQR